MIDRYRMIEAQIAGRHRRGGGFTLVELLVVVTLMSVLTGMFSLAISSARQDARIKRAQTEIDTITAILQQKINDINLAPVPLLGNTSNAASAQQRNRVVMLARRDLMRMKLPQVRADLIYPPARLQYAGINRGSGVTFPAATKVEQPAEWAQMRRVVGFAFPSGAEIEAPLMPGQQVFSAAFVDSLAVYNNTANDTVRRRLGLRNQGGSSQVLDLTVAPWPAPQTAPAGDFWTRDFESAECLYLILATTRLYGERALDQISERSIANLDNDAVPEIIDPWGVPYEFIRTPVGRVYRSPVSSNLPSVPHPAGPDSADYLRTDFRYINNDTSDPPTMLDDPYRVSPIVMSAGADGEFGIRRSFNRRGSFQADTMGISPRRSTAVTRVTNPPVSPTLAGTFMYPDPYVQFQKNGTYLSRADADPSASSFPAPYDQRFDITFFNTNYAAMDEATIASWHGDGSDPAVGLGAALLDNQGRPIEAFADDIASDDPE